MLREIDKSMKFSKRLRRALMGRLARALGRNYVSRCDLCSYIKLTNHNIHILPKILKQNFILFIWLRWKFTLLLSLLAWKIKFLLIWHAIFTKSSKSSLLYTFFFIYLLLKRASFIFVQRYTCLHLHYFSFEFILRNDCCVFQNRPLDLGAPLPFYFLSSFLFSPIRVVPLLQCQREQLE